MKFPYLLGEDTVIFKKRDGSFVLDNIYHVPNNDEFGDFYKFITEYIKSHTKNIHEEQLLPEEENATKMFNMLRQARDEKLKVTDYLAMPDYPITEAMKKAVFMYRQNLRDLPSLEGAPWDGGGPETPWPEMPEL